MCLGVFGRRDRNGAHAGTMAAFAFHLASPSLSFHAFASHPRDRPLNPSSRLSSLLHSLHVDPRCTPLSFPSLSSLRSPSRELSPTLPSTPLRSRLYAPPRSSCDSVSSLLSSSARTSSSPGPPPARPRTTSRSFPLMTPATRSCACLSVVKAWTLSTDNLPT